MKICTTCAGQVGKYSRYCRHCGVDLYEAGPTPFGEDSVELAQLQRSSSVIKLRHNVPIRPAAESGWDTEDELTLSDAHDQRSSGTLRIEAANHEASSGLLDAAVKVWYLPRITWQLLAAGTYVVPRLTISNRGSKTIRGLVVTIWITRLGDEFETVIDEIPAKSSYTISPVQLPLDPMDFRSRSDARQSTLRVKVESGGDLVFSGVYRLEILGYRQWMYHPSVAHSSAVFVTPHDDSVEELVSMVQANLPKHGYTRSFPDYHDDRLGHVRDVVNALYLTIRDKLQPVYIQPPGSSVAPAFHTDGSRSFSQAVRSPEELLKRRRGTCLDWTFLILSCLENIGLHGVLVLQADHAFPGVWLDDQGLTRTVLFSPDEARKAIERDDLLVFNSTTFTDEQKLPFQMAVKQGMELLRDDGRFTCIVDIHNSRKSGVPPLP